MLEFLCPLLAEYQTVASMIFFTSTLCCFLSWEDHYARVRNQDHSRWYRKHGVLCGGVVKDRKHIGGRLHVRYAYRLPKYPNTAYVKDFCEAPKELKAHDTTIVVVLVPWYSMSGIHYGILEKLDSNNSGASRAIRWLLCYCSFIIALWMFPDVEPEACLYWPYSLLVYSCIYQLLRMEKKVDKASGVNKSVWKTLKRRKSRRIRLASMLWEPRKPFDDLERESNEEDIFLALDRVQNDFVQIMNSLDPSASDARVTTFSCDKYFSFAPVCQEILQNDSAQLNA